MSLLKDWVSQPMSIELHYSLCADNMSSYGRGHGKVILARMGPEKSTIDPIYCFGGRSWGEGRV